MMIQAVVQPRISGTLRQIVKYRHIAAFGTSALGIGVIGYTFQDTIVANCKSQWSPSDPTNLPPYSEKWDNNWDKREPHVLLRELKSKKEREGEHEHWLRKRDVKPTATRHIILIRHGQYEMKGERDSEKCLTPLGKEQSAITGQRLKELYPNFTSIISSDMTRAIETKDIILKKLGASVGKQMENDCLLREGSPALPDPPLKCHKDKSYYEDGPRIEAAFRKYIHRAAPDQTSDSFELVVCHANVIRFFVCRALQLPIEGWLRISLANASFTILSILPNGKVILRALGSFGHIPFEKVTRT